MIKVLISKRIKVILKKNTCEKLTENLDWGVIVKFTGCDYKSKNRKYNDENCKDVDYDPKCSWIICLLFDFL